MREPLRRLNYITSDDLKKDNIFNLIIRQARNYQQHVLYYLLDKTMLTHEVWKVEKVLNYISNIRYYGLDFGIFLNSSVEIVNVILHKRGLAMVAYMRSNDYDYSNRDSHTLGGEDSDYFIENFNNYDPIITCAYMKYYYISIPTTIRKLADKIKSANSTFLNKLIILIKCLLKSEWKGRDKSEELLKSTLKTAENHL